MNFYFHVGLNPSDLFNPISFIGGLPTIEGESDLYFA